MNNTTPASPRHSANQPHPIVGVWRVHVAGAPFAYHMFVFHADGTMQQSNPPAGNIQTSDTAGLGIWAEQPGSRSSSRDRTIQARFEEYRVDRADGAITRGVVDLTLQLAQNNLSGTARFNIYTAATDQHLAGPLEATLSGQKVTLTS
jgi:hypothetical protein